MKKILILFFSVLMLVGCGTKNNERVTVCIPKEKDKELYKPNEDRYVFTHEDDILNTLEMVLVSKFNEKEEADQVQALDKEAMAKEFGITLAEGVDIIVTRKSDVEIEFAVALDFNKNKVEAYEIAAIEPDDKNLDGIVASKLIGRVEGYGYLVCESN